MTLQRSSPCKVNLILNILGKREDGFHDLETVLQPVPVADRLEFSRGGVGIRLSCSLSELPTDARNLVFQAAQRFLEAAGIMDGVAIRLEKKVPMEAGLGGGSSNAANTLRGLNELFEFPLGQSRLHELAAAIGSDVPFFLQDGPALATGRGEVIEPLEAFPALRGLSVFLVHPGFGVPTAWAYRQLVGFPASLHGRPGRARQLADCLQRGDLGRATANFYNAFEAPVLAKYPLLMMMQEFLRSHSAEVALLSGSGSALFALVRGPSAATHLRDIFSEQFGASCWIETAQLA